MYEKLQFFFCLKGYFNNSIVKKKYLCPNDFLKDILSMWKDKKNPSFQGFNFVSREGENKENIVDVYSIFSVSFRVFF
jgi:hypothetical protein